MRGCLTGQAYALLDLASGLRMVAQVEFGIYRISAGDKDMANALKTVQKYFPNVRRVVDAKRPLNIEVLDEDLNTAEVQNHQTCAMAVACKRAFDLDGAIFGIDTAYLVHGKKATRYQLPESVSREIVSFDRKAPVGVDAGDYHLKPPCKSRRLGTNHRGGRPSGRKLPPGIKRPKHRTRHIRAILGGDKDAEAA